MSQIAVRANNAAAPQPPTMQGQQVTEWLTAKEAAQHLKVKERTLLVWVRQGKVRGYALSGTKRRIWRFLRSDLNSALLSHSSSDVKLIAQSVLNNERSV